MSSATYSAIVGLGFPDALALGAATKPPAASISRCATGCDGNLTATVSSPPVVSSGTVSFLGRIMVSGPGQNASHSRCAASGTGSAIR